MIFNQNGDNEKEMSGGAMFGYALIGFVAVIVVVFIIFAVTKFVGGSKADEGNQTQIEQTIETEEDTENIIEDNTEISE
jgi:uncharacterized membrane protein YhiD involved in acid resistance